jgi:hypothetical protein
MVWTDRYTSTKVAQTVQTTLGGVPVVYSQALIAGAPITLQATEDTGWLTGAQVEAIMDMADQPGAVFELSVDGATKQVVFRHHDGVAFEASPLVPRLNQQPGDYFTATLKLMTV